MATKLWCRALKALRHAAACAPQDARDYAKIFLTNSNWRLGQVEVPSYSNGGGVSMTGC